MAKINKSAFVRSLPASMGAPEVVKAASAKGIKLSVKFVHTIRYNAKKSGAAPASPAKRGPGRPRKLAATGGHSEGNGLTSAIEAIVERKVSEMLKQRLGALFQ